jgi:hypothetical protein
VQDSQQVGQWQTLALSKAAVREMQLWCSPILQRMQT